MKKETNLILDCLNEYRENSPLAKAYITENHQAGCLTEFAQRVLDKYKELNKTNDDESKETISSIEFFEKLNSVPNYKAENVYIKLKDGYVNIKNISNTTESNTIDTTDSIKLKAELLFELKDKQEWINRVPRILPEKNRHNEHFLWVDKNGCVFELGADFMAAEELDSYPCKVYRTTTVNQFLNDYKQKNQKTEN